MRDQIKASFLSFAIHGVVFMIITGFSHFMVTKNKPILVDFSIEESKEPTAALKKQEGIAKSVKKKSEPLSPKKEELDIKEVHKPIQESPAAPPVSENQVPVAAPKIVDESGHKGMKGKLAAHDAADGSASYEAETNASGTVPVEKAKAKYLKEHFTYIRDRIVKSLSYPHMARRMGWSGKVTLSFIVSENGYVEDIKIIESSGVGILDKNAVETVKRVVPFPKPPVRAEVIIPIVYKLN